MPLTRYALIIGKPGHYVAERHDEQKPHFMIDIETEQHQWRAAINVKSRRWPSQVTVARIESFQHGIADHILALDDGLYPIRHYPKHRKPKRFLALDYVRDQLFDYDNMVPIAAHKPGPNNDIMDRLAQDVIETRRDNGRIFVWGEPYNNRGRRGIHNIHQNQGNANRYKGQNGVDQDGAVMFWHGKTLTAYFIAFQSQTYATRDGSGDGLDSDLTIFDRMCRQGRFSSFSQIK